MNNFILKSIKVLNAKDYRSMFRDLIAMFTTFLFGSIVVAVIICGMLISNYSGFHGFPFIGAFIITGIFTLFSLLGYIVTKHYQSKNNSIIKEDTEVYTIILDGELNRRTNFQMYRYFDTALIIDDDKTVVYSNESNFIRVGYIDSKYKIAKYKVYEYPYSLEFTDTLIKNRELFKENVIKEFNLMKNEIDERRKEHFKCMKTN